MKLNFKSLCLGMLSAAFILVTSQSCKKSQGELGTPATASFTVSPVTGKTNTFALSSKSTNAFRYQWNIGDGSATRAGKAEDTAYFQKKGIYVIKLLAYGRGGFSTDSQTVTVTADDFSSTLNNPIYKLLTAKTWKLDPNPTANAIIVGTEGNPGEYFGGGALAACQIDDAYSFGFANNVFNATYAANGATFNGGNVQPNYNCAADRSFVTPFTFSTSVDGVGIATITLPGFTPPTRFIGTTDISSNNYRIISISATNMVLRAGNKDETVFQFKFVAP